MRPYQIEITSTGQSNNQPDQLQCEDNTAEIKNHESLIEYTNTTLPDMVPIKKASLSLSASPYPLSTGDAKRVM